MQGMTSGGTDNHSNSDKLRGMSHPLWFFISFIPCNQREGCNTNAIISVPKVHGLNLETEAHYHIHGDLSLVAWTHQLARQMNF